MITFDWKDLLGQVSRGQALSYDQAAFAMDAILHGEAVRILWEARHAVFNLDIERRKQHADGGQDQKEGGDQYQQDRE